MPKTRFQNKQILDKRRQDIIEGSIQVFLMKSYKTITIDDITKSLNISHGLFYHYFKNKEELTKTIVLDIDESIGKKFNSISKTSDSIDFFMNLLDYYLKLIKDDKNIKKLILIKDLRNQQNPVLKSLKVNFDEQIIKKTLQNLKILNESGLLINPYAMTVKYLELLFDGLLLTSYNHENKKVFKAKNLIKTFIKEEEINV